jgi:biotin carboxyl carrier protein
MPVHQVTRIADGVYRVEHETGVTTVYVAGSADRVWAFWNGRVYQAPLTSAPERRKGRSTSASGDVLQPLTAPMPATILKVLAHPGMAVTKGDTLVVLEAMKMELPIRAPADGTVVAIHCREGELVQPDALLIEVK